MVQHRAAPDADVKQAAEKGYIPQAYLIELVESMGFKLVAQSEINANVKDTKDHSKVFGLCRPVTVRKTKIEKSIAPLVKPIA